MGGVLLISVYDLHVNINLSYRDSFPFSYMYMGSYIGKARGVPGVPLRWFLYVVYICQDLLSVSVSDVVWSIILY